MAGNNLKLLFWERATSQWERCFLIVGTRTITYGRAHSIFVQLANMMREIVAGANSSTVAVSADAPLNLLYMIWASIYSGISLAFCPHCEDIQWVRTAMKESGAELLFTDVPALSREKWAVSLIDLIGRINETTVMMDDTDNFGGEGREEPAFLFQTSGTEGDPKWVQCHYEKCSKVVECMRHEGVLDHKWNQTVFLTPPLFHSYGLSSLLEYAGVGSTIVLPSGGFPFGPVGELREKSISDRITAIEAVPDFYFQLSKIIGRISLPSIRHLGFGGGNLDIDTVNRLRQRFPQLTYSVRYGLTETPSVVSHKLFRPPYNDDWRSSGNILPIYQVEIVNDSGEYQGPEKEGEIIVRGECVANYWGERRNSPERLVKTKDIGYLTREAELVVVGRRSAFMKYRGFRLSPEQIESAIRSFRGVTDCRVSMKESQLIAEVVSDTSSLPKREFLKHLAERLPKHALPEDIVQVSQIPRTPSGKIVRHEK